MALRRRNPTQIWLLIVGAMALYWGCSGLVTSSQVDFWTFSLGHYTVTGTVALFEILLTLVIGLSLTGSSIYRLE